jgi:hypothetical protein
MSGRYDRLPVGKLSRESVIREAKIEALGYSANASGILFIALAEILREKRAAWGPVFCRA